ncbi:hypothetical protein CLCR_00349 [Cladophialophora carrionii]|uniref:Uncharacterized protein n=1 Tax=Cladophialophora carrionii TaxID=86049 RepID=A0A1C1D0C2_9EURO|nr:hypothetical protein CLCR_00349 [Cladophialophora carrionii]
MGKDDGFKEASQQLHLMLSSPENGRGEGRCVTVTITQLAHDSVCLFHGRVDWGDALNQLSRHHPCSTVTIDEDIPLPSI